MHDCMEDLLFATTKRKACTTTMSYITELAGCLECVSKSKAVVAIILDAHAIVRSTICYTRYNIYLHCLNNTFCVCNTI